MLSEKRIKEAENNVKTYLEDGILKKESFKEIVYNILKNNAQESLELAEFLAENEKSDFWVIIIAYYSMYYIANAVLYKLGYKVGDKVSHKVTADALIVYIRKKLKASLIEQYEELQKEALATIKTDSLVESFDYERKKRGFIQYQTKEFEKHSKAKTSLEREKDFNFEMKKLLLNKKKDKD